VVRESDRSDVTLVIAGAAGWKTEEVMSAAGRRAHVRLTGPVDDDDLPVLYSSAVALVYASHYEGFGLPLLEAMRCGCPVVYGRNSAMPEVVGDAGLAVDSRDMDDIARQMRRLLDDEALAHELRTRAVERARSFSWARAAAETVAAYETLLDFEHVRAPSTYLVP
jgi:glycosyltransferase involved in cell wall biosynthesis